MNPNIKPLALTLLLSSAVAQAAQVTARVAALSTEHMPVTTVFRKAAVKRLTSTLQTINEEEKENAAVTPAPKSRTRKQVKAQALSCYEFLAIENSVQTLINDYKTGGALHKEKNKQIIISYQQILKRREEEAPLERDKLRIALSRAKLEKIVDPIAAPKPQRAEQKA